MVTIVGKCKTRRTEPEVIVAQYGRGAGHVDRNLSKLNSSSMHTHSITPLCFIFIPTMQQLSISQQLRYVHNSVLSLPFLLLKTATFSQHEFQEAQIIVQLDK